MRAICVDKVKNLQETTVAYTLELEDGKTRAFAPDVLKYMIASNQLEVLNMAIQSNRLVIVDDTKKNEKFSIDELTYLAVNIAENFNRMTGTIYSNDINPSTGVYCWYFIGMDRSPKFTMYVENGRLKAKKVNDTKVFDMHTEYNIKTMSYLTGIPVNNLI